MAGSATNSAIEVAYWFISRAEDEGLFLEDEKLHHLLFLMAASAVWMPMRPQPSRPKVLPASSMRG